MRKQDWQCVPAPNPGNNGGNHCAHVGRCRDVFERQEPVEALGSITVSLVNPISRPRREILITKFIIRGSIRLPRSEQVIFPAGDAGSTMVKRLDHLSFVQRYVQLIAFLPAVALNRIKTLGIKLFRRREEMGVIGHIKHTVVADRPGAALSTA